MTEDKFEKFLKQAAESYNAPPARVAPEGTGASAEPVGGSEQPDNAGPPTPTVTRGTDGGGSKTRRQSSVRQQSDIATGRSAPPQTQSSAYQLTTVRHLSEAEALLT